MIKIRHWIMVDLIHPTVIGINHFNNEIHTDGVLGIDLKNNYVVTEQMIYKLGEPDKVWIETEQAQEILKRLEINV